MNEQAELSEYGAYVRDRLAERSGAEPWDLLAELRDRLEASGFSVPREVLAKHLSGVEEEHNYDLALAILDVLDLDEEGETEEFAVRFCFSNFAPAR